MAYGLYDGSLESIPGLGGWLQQQRVNDQRTAGDIRNASQVQGILENMRNQQQEAQVRQILSSTADPAAAIPALMKAGPLGLQAAAQLQGLQKAQTEQRQRSKVEQFYSPENIAKYRSPDKVTETNADVPELRAVQTTPGAMDFNKFLQDAAGQGVVNPETYANHLATREQARLTAENTRASREATLQAHLMDIRGRMEDRDLDRASRERLAQQHNAVLQSIASLRAEGNDAPHMVAGVDANGNQVVNWARPSDGAKTFDGVKPASTFNADLSRGAQIQKRYSSDTKPIIDALDAGNQYQNLRAQGDFAQASKLAAEVLRRAIRAQGGQRFKSDASGLLGSGYGSGNLEQRFENFMSNEFSKGGGPTQDTMKKLDALLASADNTNFENLASRAKWYAAQAKGQNIPLRSAIGMPYVRGSHVVFPDGTHAQFKTPQDAEAKAQLWTEANQ